MGLASGATLGTAETLPTVVDTGIAAGMGVAAGTGVVVGTGVAVGPGAPAGKRWRELAPAVTLSTTEALLTVVATGAVVGTVALAAELAAPGVLRDVTSLTGAAGRDGADAVALLMTSTGEGAVVLGAVMLAVLGPNVVAAGAAAAVVLPV